MQMQKKFKENNKMIKTKEEFKELVASIEDFEEYKKPLAFGVARVDYGQVHTDKVIHAVYPLINWNENFGSGAVIIRALIENGILTGYMQDRLNSKLMGVNPTGNGRRESYAHLPMPRMTNTYMLSGNRHPEEILKSVKNGLYAVDFGGGQVDITSGKFVFTCTEAYKIENGKVTNPVKGATLIGNGPDVLKRVKMVGNDSKMDTGIGTCGKDGQSVPVGVGQPTMLIENLTVGGTATA
jgi:hypothetical protein